MKKKQLFVFLITAALAVGAVPSAVLAAAEETASVSVDGTASVTEAAAEETVTDISTEETPAAEEPTAEEPTAEEPAAETTPEAAADNQTAAPTEAAQETETAQEVVEDTQTTDETNGGEATLDLTKAIHVLDTDGSTVVGTYDTLKDAIASVPDGGTADSATKIVLRENQAIAETIEIGAKHIILAAGAENLRITRDAACKGDLFTVGEGSLQFAAGQKTDDAGTVTVCNLAVDGSLEGADDVTGALVHITNAAGVFGLQANVTLQGNTTSAKGSAILNDNGGMIALTGGTITGNTSKDAAGGAIYSTGTITLSGQTAGESGTIVVNDNRRQDDTAGNIVLEGENAYLRAMGTLENSEIHVTSSTGLAENQPLVALGTDAESNPLLTVEEMTGVVGQITYDDTNYQIVSDSTTGAGMLTPVTKPDPEPSTVTPTVVTPTPTAKPTTAPKLKLSNKKNIKWTGRTTAAFKFSGDKNGRYYITWNQDKSVIPSFKAKDAVSSFAADQTVIVNVENITAEDGKDVYVYLFAVDDSNVKAVPLRYTLKAASRPAEKQTNVETRDPIVPAVTESIVRGLDEPLEFYPNQFYDFTVIGAGTQSTAEQVKNPVEGDVQWRPLYWSTSSNPSTKNQNTQWRIGAKTGIKQAKTFKMYIFFQKYRYNGKEWQATDTIQSAAYNFQSKAISFDLSGTPSPTSLDGDDIYEEGGYGYEEDDDGTEATSRDGDDSSTGTTSSADGASTADNSPIHTMMTLAGLSLLTAGYVLVRKRKRT